MKGYTGGAAKGLQPLLLPLFASFQRPPLRQPLMHGSGASRVAPAASLPPSFFSAEMPFKQTHRVRRSQQVSFNGLLVMESERRSSYVTA